MASSPDRRHLLAPDGLPVAPPPPEDAARLRPGPRAVEPSFDRAIQAADGAADAALFPGGGMVSPVAAPSSGERRAADGGFRTARKPISLVPGVRRSGVAAAAGVPRRAGPIRRARGR